MKINHLDLFSGIGGFHKGFQQAGYKVNSYFSEIDKHAIAVYQNQFKDAEYVGSVVNIKGDELPRINLLTFGSPCQDFSLAGKRKGMSGDRSSLVLEAIRLISECRPGVFIWENVKGTFSSNSGEDFAAILQAFTNIGGYRLEWQLLNTSWFLPQNRERIYLVGYSTTTKRNWRGVFPIGESAKVFNTKEWDKGQESTSLRDKNSLARALNARASFGQGSDDTFIQSPYLGITDKRGNQKSMEKASTLCAGYSKAPSDGDYIKMNTNYNYKNLNKTIEQNPTSFKEVVQPKIIGYTRDAKGKVVARHLKDTAGTIHTGSGQGGNTDQFVQDYRIRRLTPIECERLQGFPDNHTSKGIYDGEVKKMSNTQRYKQCGNAVTVDVVQAIAEKIKPLFK